MKKIMKSLLCSLILVFLATGVSFGAGFKLPEQGTKAMGMSMAWTAQASDPSAIYFNPAGITQLEGHNILLGGTVFLANGSEFTGTVLPGFPPPIGGGFATSESGKDQIFFGPYSYYVYQANDKVWMGIGINPPFGLARTYNVDGAIRFALQHVMLKTIVVNPTLAIKINDMVSIGFGGNYMYGDAELDRDFSFAGPPGTFGNFHLEGVGRTWGWNVGLLITHGDHMRYGFSYRSGYDLDIRGDGSFTSALNPGTLTTGGTTKIRLPDIVNLGIAYQSDRFTIEFDYDWTKWSSFKTLDIILGNDIGLSPIVGGTGTFLPQTRNWENVAAYRLGFKYNFTDRCYGSVGIFYDETPVPEATLSALLPDSDRRGFSLGTGYQLDKIGFDIAYMYFNYRDREVSFPTNLEFDGTWENVAHLFGFNVTYAF